MKAYTLIIEDYHIKSGNSYFERFSTKEKAIAALFKWQSSTYDNIIVKWIEEKEDCYIGYNDHEKESASAIIIEFDR